MPLQIAILVSVIVAVLHVFPQAQKGRPRGAGLDSQAIASPYVFGFLVLAPYVGNAIGRLLGVWSFIIVLTGINYLYPSGFVLTAIYVGLGWLLITLLSTVVCKPIIALRNKSLAPDQWSQVNPFESLAGAHPHDDIVVKLRGPIQVESSVDAQSGPIIHTSREPVQITGRNYALIRFLEPTEPGSELYKVVHYNLQNHTFDGEEEVVRLPQVVANANGVLPSTGFGIEFSPINEAGW